MKQLPTTDRGRRTRAAIVAAAARLMHERGLAAPSMDEVLAASGTGKSQLYHYFDGKHDLATAVLQHQFEQVMAQQPSLSDPEGDDLHRWRDEVLRAHRAQGLGSCPLGAFVGQTSDDPALRETLKGLFAQWQDAIAGLVARARGAGLVHPDADPDVAGGALLTALQGGTMLSHLRGEPETLARALDAVVDGLTSSTEASPAEASPTDASPTDASSTEASSTEASPTDASSTESGAGTLRDSGTGPSAAGR